MSTTDDPTEFHTWTIELSCAGSGNAVYLDSWRVDGNDLGYSSVYTSSTSYGTTNLGFVAYTGTTMYIRNMTVTVLTPTAAPTPLPSASWSYFYQSDGTCANAIPDEAGCEAAAIALGFDISTNYNGDHDSGSHPIGCYLMVANENIVWNVNSGGTGCTTARNCVCRSS